MDDESDGLSSNAQNLENDHKSNDNDMSSEFNAANGLRRSERMARNQNSYGLYKRRS